jgi:pimeloyl-ACP methyl ester carboxylesterase
MAAQPFRIDVPPATLEDLRARLERARIPEGMPGAGWDYGTSPDYLRELCSYWRLEFDWRKQENHLNSFRHFKAEIENDKLHFIHERGRGPNPIPLLLLHGWPDSFARFLKVIPLLTDPEANGAPDQPSFDVIVPSLPGFGFSDRPRKQGATFGIGDRLHKLMVDELGYRRFAVQGGDWGGSVAELMARSHPASVLGIHLTDVPYVHMLQKLDDPTPTEKKFLEHLSGFQQKEGAYALIQSTKPETLACGLNDSPIGLASWILEKFRSWSDCHGDLSTSFSRDDLLTNIMIYWVTQTIDSSFFPYYDLANAGALRWMSEGVKGWLGSKEVPVGFALFPKDITNPPREWVERFFNVQHWTEMPRGGHFAALEEPELFVKDLRKMFGPLWARETTGQGRPANSRESAARP